MLLERVNKYQKQIKEITSAIFNYVKKTLPNQRDSRGIFEEDYFIPGTSEELFLTFRMGSVAHSRKIEDGIHLSGQTAGIGADDYDEDEDHYVMEITLHVYDKEAIVWENLYDRLLRVITHEYEHFLQDLYGNKRVFYDVEKDADDRDWGKFYSGDEADKIAQDIYGDKDAYVNSHLYYLLSLPSELEADLKAHWFVANRMKNRRKYRGYSKADLFRLSLIPAMKRVGLKEKEIDYVIDRFVDYAKKHFPNITI